MKYRRHPQSCTISDWEGRAFVGHRRPRRTDCARPDLDSGADQRQKTLCLAQRKLVHLAIQRSAEPVVLVGLVPAGTVRDWKYLSAEWA